MAVRLLAAMLAGMWLTAFQPLPVFDGRSDGCHRGGAAAIHQVVLSPAQTDCHDSHVACLVSAGCVTVTTALPPTRPTLSSLLIPRLARDRVVTPIADLFQARPPTPPPNS